jgi:hypothetical protein
MTQFEKNKLAIGRVKSHLGKQIVCNELVQVLDKLISFCENNNIKIVCVRYPLSREYVHYAMNFDIDSVEKIFQARSGHFSAILNYKDLFSDKPQYFSDVDHLNLEGAIIFTKILKHDMEYGISQANGKRP